MSTLESALEYLSEDVATARVMAPYAVQCDVGSWATYTTATPSTSWVDDIASEGLCACCGDRDADHTPEERAACQASL